MVRYLIYASLFFNGLSYSTSAQLSLSPPPLEERFERATAVCLCSTVSVVQTNAVQGNNGKLLPADYDATLTPLKMYKGATRGSRFHLNFVRLDPMGGAPLKINKSYLVFLERTSDGSWVASDLPGSIEYLPISISSSGSQAGIAELSADLINGVSVASNPSDVKQLFNLFGQFNNVDDAAMNRLNQMVGRKGPETDVRILVTLARSSSDPSGFSSRLIKILASHPELGSVDPERLPDLIIQAGSQTSNYDDLVANCQDVRPVEEKRDHCHTQDAASRVK